MSLLSLYVTWLTQERNRLLSVGEKIQFNVMDFIVKLKKSEGTRYARISEMMWETEYVEWATKTAKGGYLSKEEAVANWEKWKQDAGHTRDQKGHAGAEGFVCVWYFAVLVSFNTFGFGRSIQDLGAFCD